MADRPTTEIERLAEYGPELPPEPGGDRKDLTPWRRPGWRDDSDDPEASPTGPPTPRLSGGECFRLGFGIGLGLAVAGIVLAVVVGVASLLLGWGLLAYIASVWPR